MNLDPPTPVERVLARRRLYWWLFWLAVIALVIYWLVFVNQYVIAHDDEREHFKYGSIGSEPENGLPYWVFRALPAMYRDELGSGGYRRFGLLYESDDADLPIGTSRRVVTGFERVWLNCSVCHVGTVRRDPQSERVLIYGAPSNNLRLQELIKFLIRVGADPKFNAESVIAAIESEEVGGDLTAVERLIYRFVIVPRVRKALQRIGVQLEFIHRQRDWGPGRVDTFNPYKAIQFNFPMGPGALSEIELNGASDYPSIWEQGPREGMNLHWDGNNDSVAERNLSAALGAGVTPTTVDIAAIARIERWMWNLRAPPFPFPDMIDEQLAEHGRRLYARYCADCHGMSYRPTGSGDRYDPAAGCAQRARSYAPDYGRYGRYGYAAAGPLAAYDATDGERAGSLREDYCYDTNRFPRLGQVVALAAIGTDPGRWASYTESFAGAQNLLYAGYPWRFDRFRKTDGYANHPLDGIWARSPYLHNGSVPTLRDLLEPAARRPAVWTRGSDVFDPVRVGYRSDGVGAAPDHVFVYDTSVPGNSRAGHEGVRYGTHLPPRDKDAIVEYMKKL